MNRIMTGGLAGLAIVAGVVYVVRKM